MADANDGGSKELSFPKNKIKVLLLEAIHLQALADFEVRRCPGWAVTFHLSRGLFMSQPFGWPAMGAPWVAKPAPAWLYGRCGTFPIAMAMGDWAPGLAGRWAMCSRVAMRWGVIFAMAWLIAAP